MSGTLLSALKLLSHWIFTYPLLLLSQLYYSWVGKFPWRRKWQPTQVFLPGESHGQRSLAGSRDRKSQTLLSAIFLSLLTMFSTILSALKVLSHWIFTYPYGVGTTLISIVQTKKPRYTEVSSLPKASQLLSHTAGMHTQVVWNPVLNPTPHLLSKEHGIL